MTSGVKVNEEVATIWNDIKIGHKYKLATFKMNDDSTEIVLDELFETADYEQFVAVCKEGECRYVVFDFHFELPDGGKREKLIFVVWVPDNCKVKPKMLYASSKDAIKAKFNGLQLEVQANGRDDVLFETILEKCKKK